MFAGIYKSYKSYKYNYYDYIYYFGRDYTT